MNDQAKLYFASPHLDIQLMTLRISDNDLAHICTLLANKIWVFFLVFSFKNISYDRFINILYEKETLSWL